MLLLLHGALADQTQFDALKAQLGNAPVMTVNFEGHGVRPLHDAPMRMERLVDNAVEFLDEHHVTRASVFGYSMGGYAALLLASRHPGRIERVMTLGTKLHWTPGIAARETVQLDPETIRTKVPAFAALLEQRHVAHGWETLLRDTAGMMEQLGEQPLLDANTYAQISCPVRLCVGDRDKTVSVEETLAAQKLLSHAELEVLPRTAHPFERVAMPRLLSTMREFFGLQ